MTVGNMFMMSIMDYLQQIPFTICKWDLLGEKRDRFDQVFKFRRVYKLD